MGLIMLIEPIFNNYVEFLMITESILIYNIYINMEL